MKSLTVVLIFSVLFLTSCSSKINSENYNKISNGMSKSEVQAILGDGESQAESSVDMGEYGGEISSEVVTWQDGMKVISITFSNGKVLAKAKTGL
jgi:hypothetical protein